jgi:hypothetical protein
MFDWLQVVDLQLAVIHLLQVVQWQPVGFGFAMWFGLQARCSSFLEPRTRLLSVGRDKRKSAATTAQNSNQRQKHG